MNITLTNNQIYNYTDSFIKNFSQRDIKFPVKVNFYLLKNQKALLGLAQEIEQERVNIAQEYGILNEETQQYEVPPEKIQEAKKKLDDLFNLTQEVKIYKVKLEDFGNIELTPEPIVTTFKLLQSAKAWLPMLDTEFGMTISFRLEHPEKS